MTELFQQQPEETGHKRSTLAQATVVCAIIFGVSLGLCGVGIAMSNSGSGIAQALVGVGILSSIGILIGGLGLLICGSIWIVKQITESF